MTDTGSNLSVNRHGSLTAFGSFTENDIRLFKVYSKGTAVYVYGVVLVFYSSPVTILRHSDTDASQVIQCLYRKIFDPSYICAKTRSVSF